MAKVNIINENIVYFGKPNLKNHFKLYKNSVLGCDRY